MKSFLPPIALLALLLCATAWNSAVMSRETARWADQLEQADALADNGDWITARETLREGYTDWCSRQTYLHIVEEHDVVDGAEAMYRRAWAFALTEELTEFRAEVAGLRSQLRLLAEMERFSIKNVL